MGNFFIGLDLGRGMGYTALEAIERLAKRHGHELLYVKLWKCWLIYDGRRWVKDERGQIVAFCIETAHSIRMEAAKVEHNSKRAKAVWGHAMKSESQRSIQAMQELANLHHLPGSKRAVKPILAMLTSQNQADTLIVAATALSVLGSGDDPRVIDALASTTLSHDGEVAWSAALALARLGSDRAKSTLLDLLDRRFWETGERYRVMAPDGTVRLYPMPPARIDQLLVAAIEAVSNLGNAELWEVVEGLQTDASPAVRGAVAKAMGARTGKAISAVVKD